MWTAACAYQGLVLSVWIVHGGYIVIVRVQIGIVRVYIVP